MIKTGFKNIDEIFDISKSRLIFLTGDYMHFIETLSGDIANNISIKQDKDALEIVDMNKEYLIKRIVVNNANVNYNKWTLKNEYEDKKYSDDELKQISLATMNLIETTQKLPIIIERKLTGYSLKRIKRFILNYANTYADREEAADTLVVIDITNFNYDERLRFKGESNFFRQKNKEKFIKQIKKISEKLKCPIMVLFSKNSIFNKTQKYADVIMALNRKDDELFVLEIDEGYQIKKCELKYNYECRKFESI